MASTADLSSAAPALRWRYAARAAALVLLLLPLVGMQFMPGMDWSLFDFVLFGTLVLGADVAFELLSLRGGSLAYRFAAACAVGASFLLVWINLAVGIIGSEDNPANLGFALVLLIVVVGAVAVRGQAGGLTWTMLAAATVQALIGAVALSLRLGSDAPSFPHVIVMLTAVFTGLWLLSAGLFAAAARRPSA